LGWRGGLNLYGFAGGDPVNFSDPFGLCPENVSRAQGVACVLIESTTAILGSGAGFLGGGGGGLLASVPTGGLAAPLTVPAGAIAGAAVGGVAGKLTGQAITNILFSKGESAEIGQAIESAMGKKSNTEPNRRGVGRYCEECKREGITGKKNSRGDFTFEELKTRVREFFGRN